MVLDDTTTLDGILQDMYFEGKFNASTFQRNDVLRIVNKYYRQMQEGIRSINEDFYTIVATTDLVIGDGSYTFPNDNTSPAYEKVTNILVALLPKDKTNPLANEYERVDIVQPNSITNPGYEFTQPTAIVYGDYFVLHPLITDTTLYPVTRGVKMTYIPQLDKLTQPTDVPKIFPDYHDVIVWGSLMDIAQRLGNQELGQKAEKQFKQRMKDMKEHASNRILDLQSAYTEGQENAGGWEFPFGQTSMS